MELTPRLEEWLEDIRLRHPHYTNEQILFAALMCGLDLLRRDERLAWRLRKWYPPVTTADRFPFVAFRILSGKICTHVPKPPVSRHLIRRRLRAVVIVSRLTYTERANTIRA